MLDILGALNVSELISTETIGPRTWVESAASG